MMQKITAEENTGLSLTDHGLTQYHLACLLLKQKMIVFVILGVLCE